MQYCTPPKFSHIQYCILYSMVTRTYTHIHRITFAPCFWVLVLIMAAREIILGKVSSVHVAITYVYKATHLDTRNGESLHCESGKNVSSTTYVIWIIYGWVNFCIVPQQEKHVKVRLAPAALAPVFSKGDKQNISHVCILFPSYTLFFTFGPSSLKFVSSIS